MKILFGIFLLVIWALFIIFFPKLITDFVCYGLAGWSMGGIIYNFSNFVFKGR